MNVLFEIVHGIVMELTDPKGCSNWSSIWERDRNEALMTRRDMLKLRGNAKVACPVGGKTARIR